MYFRTAAVIILSTRGSSSGKLLVVAALKKIGRTRKLLCCWKNKGTLQGGPSVQHRVYCALYHVPTSLSCAKLHSVSIKTHCSQSACNLNWSAPSGQELWRCDSTRFSSEGIGTNNRHKSRETSLCSTQPKWHWLPWVSLSGFDNISIKIEMSTILWGRSSLAGLTTVRRGLSVLQLVMKKSVYWYKILRSHEIQMDWVPCQSEHGRV